MKRDRLLGLAIIVLIVLNLFSLGMLWRTQRGEAAPRYNRESSGDFRSSRFLYKELNFSDAQKVRVADLQRKHVAGMRELEHSHSKLRRAYLNMALSEHYQPVRGDSLIDAMADLNARMQQKTWLLFRSIYEICNSDQQVKYRRLMLEVNKRRNKQVNPPVPFRKESH